MRVVLLSLCLLITSALAVETPLSGDGKRRQPVLFERQAAQAGLCVGCLACLRTRSDMDRCFATEADTVHASTLGAAGHPDI